MIAADFLPATFALVYKEGPGVMMLFLPCSLFFLFEGSEFDIFWKKIPPTRSYRLQLTDAATIFHSLTDVGS